MGFIVSERQVAQHKLHILSSVPVPEGVQVELVGTMYTHGEGDDFDYVVYIPGDTADFLRAELALMAMGYTATGKDSGDEDEFNTYRRGDVNIMLTNSPQFLADFLVAAEVVKYVVGMMCERTEVGERLPVTKEQRIKLHRLIMNGETTRGDL
jgi:hypothetical protein